MRAAAVDWMPKLADTSDLLSYLQNDHGNSQRVIAVHGNKMRYCHELRKWVVWDGQRWAIDTTEQAHKLAKDALLRYLYQAVKQDSDTHQKFARQSLDSKRITCALRECQPEIFITLNELDAHPHLLNFQNGTLDLRIANLMPHNPAHMLTKLVRYEYNPNPAEPEPNR